MQWTRLPANHGPDLVPGSNILARYRFYSEAEAAQRGDGYREIGTNLGSVLVCLHELVFLLEQSSALFSLLHAFTMISLLLPNLSRHPRLCAPVW